MTQTIYRKWWEETAAGSRCQRMGKRLNTEMKVKRLFTKWWFLTSQTFFSCLVTHAFSKINFSFSKGKFTKKPPNKTKKQANKSNSQTEETTKPVLKKLPTKQRNKKKQVVFHSWEALSGLACFQQHPSHVYTRLSSELELCEWALFGLAALHHHWNKQDSCHQLPSAFRLESMQCLWFPHFHSLL